MVLAVDAYSVAERARELCYETSVLHDLVGELRATAAIACQQAHVARHEARERRQVVKCHRYLRRSTVVYLGEPIRAGYGLIKRGPSRQRDQPGA